MQAADHFRIAGFGPICASSLYFDQAPGLSCTCYDEGGPGQCPFHPFGKSVRLSHNSKRSCEEVVLAYANAWSGNDLDLDFDSCIMLQAALAMMVGIFDYTPDHYVQLSQAYDGFDLKPLLHHLVYEHFRRNLRFGNRLRGMQRQKESDTFDRLDIFTMTVDEVTKLLEKMNTVDAEGVGVSCHFDKDDFAWLTRTSEMINQILEIDEIGHSYVCVESHEGEYEEVA